MGHKVKIYEVRKTKKTDEAGGMPLIGDPFPKIKNVKTTQGIIKLPKEYKGKWFILFSHPADFTPVCTTEFLEFQRHYIDFKLLNCELIGLSVDQVTSHLKWIEWIKENFNIRIEFPVIADNGEIASKLGLIHPAKGTNTVRAVIIVDPEGIIRAMIYYPQELGRNLSEIVRAVEGLRIADDEKVAIPADWPLNRRFGSNVIVPPAQSQEEIIERKQKVQEGEYACIDWWLCHKPWFKKYKTSEWKEL
ncbi:MULTISPECIES: peroxiredoxin [Methanobacterium]|uniref:Peroxiredoxin n=1 Tax=Methanobacterium bryantii TaxID=2161 RepID=A0A2A2H3W5_METBR|nr:MULTISPECIES: peroxiredoxin [Methanobacterium]OEC86779.1 peroxiredoxin [Methanobacterium sp. A39]PAV04057.1 peroxiredoxin [Methanobacterium bryantii]